jgi:uncharacterized surface protein with fasciclin (FAS1) repeats
MSSLKAKKMKTKNFVNSIKKFAGFAAALLMLPAIAACAPDQTAEVPPAQTIPPGVAVNTPIPSTSATTNEDIKDVVAANPSLSTLRNLLDETDLDEKLDDSDPYTLFAPSDQAFAALPELTRQRLLKPQNRQLLRQVLAYHVIPGNLTANQIQPGEVQTLGNNPVNVQVDQVNNQVRVNDARVIQADIQASNGVIHIVDRVILPPMIQ